MDTNATYTRRSLALMYFPDMEGKQAVRRLTYWIKLCKPLYEELTANDQKFNRRRYLTLREVRLIMKHLGEP